MKLIALLLPLVLVACASAPRQEVVQPKKQDPSGRAALTAAKMIGKPYRYGGTTPSGFDCSGLIHFSYGQAGVSLPRSTAEQRLATQRVKLAELKPGDLLFFDERGRKNSHVGIYLGERRFAHAPSSGKSVRNDSLDNPYWKKSLSEVRRIGA